MGKKTIRKLYSVCLTLILSATLCGCSLIPELSLTQEQTELISEYAAGLLVKYQKGHSMGFTYVFPSNDADEEPETVQLFPSEEIVVETPDDSEIEDLTADVSDELALSDSGEVVESSVPTGQALGLSGFDVNYSDYEFAYIYPENETEELIFSMQASPGNELLIVHFNVTNTSDIEAECDVSTANVKARVTINGGERIPAQSTILMNDLLNYQDAIAPYGMADAVLVFEVPEGTEDSMNALNLVIKNGEDENVYKLI